MPHPPTLRAAAPPLDSTRRACLAAAAGGLLSLGLGLRLGHAAGLGVAHAMPRPAAALWPVVVAVSRRDSLSQLPLLLAQTLGFFEQEGLALQLLEADSDESALRAVGRGGATLAACDYSLILSQQAKGLEWRSLVQQTRTPQVVLGASTRLYPDIKSVPDLRGRRVGLLLSGPCTTLLDTVLRRSGLTLADVVLMPMRQPSEVVQAYRAGQVDAFSLNDVAVVGLEQAGLVRVLADTRSLRDTREVFGGLLPGVSICAPLAWVAQQPAVAQKVVDAMVHALKWMQTAGPTDLAKVMPEAHFEPHRALYLTAVDKAREGFAVDGLMSAEAAETALAIRGSLEPAMRLARVDVARTYTNEFAQRAKQRFRA